MGSHGVTCHPAEGTFPPLPQPIKADTQFSDPRWKQGWVDVVGLVTYQGGIPAQRRSLIPALTGLNGLKKTKSACVNITVTIGCDFNTVNVSCIGFYPVGYIKQLYKTGHLLAFEGHGASSVCVRNSYQILTTSITILLCCSYTTQLTHICYYDNRTILRMY